MTTPAGLVSSWRAEADRFETWGACAQAAMLRHAADELEAAVRAEADVALTMAQASAESGYTTDHLTRQIRAGKIPNSGRPHAPRILRAHLPHKPGALRCASAGDNLSDVRRRMAATVAHSRIGD